MPAPASVYGPDRSILITGASSGIGAALARQIAPYGGRVALFARREERLHEVSDAVAAAGGQPLVLPGDVTDVAAVAEAHRTLVSRQGPVDVAFLNAGAGDPVGLTRFTSERVRRLFEVNVFGVVHWLEALLPDMISRRRGILVVTSSLAALRGLPGSCAYSASKAAISTLVEGLRVEARPFDLQITTVEPGFVKSEMTEKARFPKPFLVETDDAAGRIVLAVARGQTVLRFPWQMAGLMRLVHHIPDPLYERLGPLLGGKK